MDAHSSSINRQAYDRMSAGRLIHGSPHLRFASIRLLYLRLLNETMDLSGKREPLIVDLGAGEGTATLPCLKSGARVIAIDVSQAQLDRLSQAGAPYRSRLETVTADAGRAIGALAGRPVDIILANSFLHHVPDYLALVREATTLLGPGGQFMSFQDPLRYDTVSRFTRLFTTFFHVTARMADGDIIGGMKRRLRRSRGTFLPEDDVEYHVARNGVDHAALQEALRTAGFTTRLTTYYSSINPAGQTLGTLLRLRNQFALHGIKERT